MTHVIIIINLTMRMIVGYGCVFAIPIAGMLLTITTGTCIIVGQTTTIIPIVITGTAIGMDIITGTVGTTPIAAT